MRVFAVVAIVAVIVMKKAWSSINLGKMQHKFDESDPLRAAL